MVGDTPVKLTRDAKAAIQLVFEDLGGTQRLLEWANAPGNLGIFYTQIWSKIIPKDIKAEHGGPGGGPVKMTISWMEPDEVEDAQFVDPNSTEEPVQSSDGFPE